jgi:hypothetical protein
MMASFETITGLKIEQPNLTPKSENFVPPYWPPPNDFPVTIDSQGNIVSRYGDSIWHLTPWASRVLTINFGDGPCRSNCPIISKENAKIFREITALWLYGIDGVKTVNGLTLRFDVMRSFFVFCSKHNISAAHLMRFPALVDMLPDHIRPSSARYFILLLHDIWEQRELLKFVIFDISHLHKLSRYFSRYESLQTPYIPPRIWIYQLQRLSQFLDEFIEKKQNIEDCFNFMINAYAHNLGSLHKACSEKIPPSHNPFYNSLKTLNGKRNGRSYYGQFSSTAERFNILNLINRWSGDIGTLGPKAMSSYFNMASLVGIAYIANFSLMRIDEIRFLRANCLTIDHDEEFNQSIYLLHGVTTKTVTDDDAYWITSSSVEKAVTVMQCVAKLRMLPAEANLNINISKDELDNPYLLLRTYEPWRIRNEINHSMKTRPTVPAYGSLIHRFTKLFELDKLRITESDLEAARLITPSLNPDIFKVGEVWPLGWHQLRRTGAVNMAASGLVSDSSVQYQLKHAAQTMTRYYAQGFYHVKLKLNKEARGEYVKTMYEMVATSFKLLQTDRFISPHGDKRKTQILELVNEKDHQSLITSAKNGAISYRETIFGACVARFSCPYGGFENITHCGGGNGKPPCRDSIYDRRKIEVITKLKKVISERIKSVEIDSPLYVSLLEQKNAAENILNALTKK